jgi:DNA (cytosine-5)-methyltransferase 1
MRVVSLFDGMSCGHIALNRIGITPSEYFSFEIDTHAIKETMTNFPDALILGDVRDAPFKFMDDIDLLIGGSPCQSFSFSGKGEGMVTDTNEEILTLDRYMELKNNGFVFKGQSYLFWEYVRALTDIRSNSPNVKFLLENVVMPKKWEKVITETLGVEPIHINSQLVSAQCRKRLYWTNIEGVQQPEDRGIKLIDILDDTTYTNKATIVGRKLNDQGKRVDSDKSIPTVQCLEVRDSNIEKCNCITTVAKDNVLTNLPIGRHKDVYGLNLPYRNYTIDELCRLQTVPTDYFKNSSDSQIRKMLGNGWTVDVIAHILSYLKKDEQ